MSTTCQKWMRSGMTLVALAILLGATGAAGYVPAAASGSSTGPAARATASTCANINHWQLAPGLNALRLGGGSVVADGHIFALGGMVYWHEVSNVESAPIGADGALGSWIATTPLTSINQAMGAVAAKGYVYVIGGWDGSQGLARVERAAVLADGQLGAWEPQEPLPSAYGRITLAAVTTGTQIYALGGYNYSGTDVSHDVERAAINPDGSIGPWVSTSAMLIGRRSFGAVIAGKFIYVLGGSEQNNPGAAQSVERAEINADGSLGAWQEMVPLAQPRISISALVSGGYLYAIGGGQDTYEQSYNTVERTAIQPDGSLGPWQYVDPLITARAGAFSASFNGRFYLIGGTLRDDNGHYALINTSEQVTASDLAVPRDPGISINDGALFTNQTAVSLTISAQSGTVQMKVSNDGGFAGADWQDCVSPLPWTITQYGNSTIARVVYVKFEGADGVVSSTYSDDIILDVTAPTGTVQLKPMGQAANLGAFGGGLQASRPAFNDVLTHTIYLPLVMGQVCTRAPCPLEVMLTLSASDDASGVGSMEIGNDPAFSFSQWEPYATNKAWYLPGGANTVYARFRDNAGNVSSVVTASGP